MEQEANPISDPEQVIGDCDTAIEQGAAMQIITNPNNIASMKQVPFFDLEVPVPHTCFFKAMFHIGSFGFNFNNEAVAGANLIRILIFMALTFVTFFVFFIYVVPVFVQTVYTIRSLFRL